MSLPVILDPEARAEFDEAYDWYQAEMGRGEAFAREVRQVFDRIGSMPRMHAPVVGDVRKAVVRRFPYCVYYREESDCVRVLAVFHTRRHPSGWQDRV